SWRSCLYSCSPTTSPVRTASTWISRGTWRRRSPSSSHATIPPALTRRVPALVACLAVPAAILAGCGGGGGGSVDVGPAAAVPANTPIYLDATVKPTGSAKTNADDALKTILHTDDPAAKIIAQIDKQKTATGQPVNYQTDIAP